jgi:hypothetical protein
MNVRTKRPAVGIARAKVTTMDSERERYMRARAAKRRASVERIWSTEWNASGF